MSEPIYEDVEENGLPSLSAANDMERKARSPKTPLQQLALQAIGRKYFESSRQHKAFKTFEVKAMGADDESRIWYAWLKNRIELAIKYRSSLENLLRSFANDVKREVWFAGNRKSVLAKPTIEQLSSGMEDRMKQLMERKSK